MAQRRFLRPKATPRGDRAESGASGPGLGGVGAGPRAPSRRPVNLSPPPRGGEGGGSAPLPQGMDGRLSKGSRVSLSKTRDFPNSGEADEVRIGVVVHNSGSPNPASEIVAPGCRRQTDKRLKTRCALVSSIAKWSWQWRLPHRAVIGK